MALNWSKASKIVNNLLSCHFNVESTIIRITLVYLSLYENDKETIRSSLKLLKYAHNYFNSIGITNYVSLENQLIQNKTSR